MPESGGDERIEANRRLKTPEKEDRLSALPDSLIHHILSHLPSTKEAIQTGILSKRWLNQWTFVSNLIFDFSFMFSAYRRDGIPIYTSIISGILNQTLVLHQCSKIQKFHIRTDMFYSHEYNPNSEDMIRFVVSKRVEELILEFADRKPFRLPEFFFSQPLLVKLKLVRCSIMPAGMVNWRNLKDLSVTLCDCTDEVITSIVSASPLLQSLEVKYCFQRFNGPVLASKSLKRLVLCNLRCCVDISCPNLVEFYGRHTAVRCENFGGCDTNTVLEKFLSDSPLLEKLELVNFQFTSAIATKLFKKVLFKKGN